MIKLAPGLSLPIDAVTQTFGIMARKGAGKTYCAQKLGEGMLDAKAQIVVLDPIGNWWGLRLSADGKTPAYSIPVFGGLRGDIPLDPAAGQLVADVVADTGTSVIIDVSQFRKAERKRFVADFCERLFMRRKKEPAPTHVFFEEAQAFIPQRLGKDDTRMAGAVEDIVRLGRNFGLGATMISQRPQSVNKEVFNQVECLIMLQINGAHERKAVEQWVTYQGIDVEAMVKKLPSLKVGEAFVWSPQWLDILKKVKIAPKKTFDASATPIVGIRKRKHDRSLGRVDLDKIRERMQTIPEEIKTLDDAQKEIRKLKRELRTAANGKATVDTTAVRDLNAELTRLRRELTAERARSRKTLKHLSNGALDALRTSVDALGTAGTKIQRVLQALADTAESALPEEVAEASTPAPPQPSQGRSQRAPPQPSRATSVTPGKRRILVALAQHQQLERTQLALYAQFTPKSGTFAKYLGELRSGGLVEASAGLFTITNAGVEELGGEWDPLPEGPELVQYWLAEVGGGKSRILSALIEAGSSGLSRDDLADASDMTLSSGTFAKYLSQLRSLKLVEKGNPIRATPTLLEAR